MPLTWVHCHRTPRRLPDDEGGDGGGRVTAVRITWALLKSKSLFTEHGSYRAVME